MASEEGPSSSIARRSAEARRSKESTEARRSTESTDARKSAESAEARKSAEALDRRGSSETSFATAEAAVLVSGKFRRKKIP